MAQKTAIEWTDYTANPIRAINTETGKRGHFCVHASPGCENCYAERLNRWRGNGLEFIQPNAKRVEFVLDQKEIASWRRLPAGARVFVCDMCDLFLPEVPDEMIDAVFAGFALAPHVTFQVLTKRAGRMLGYLTQPSASDRMLRIFGTVGDLASASALDRAAEYPLPNVWLGVSAEDQRRADERVPLLLQCPAAVRFVSAEPLLGPVDLAEYLAGNEGNGIAPGRPVGTCIAHTPPLDWVIAGGESGPGARPMHPDWARSIRDACQAAGVAFFFKQHGQWAPVCDLPDYDALYEPAPSRDPEAARRCKVRTEVLQLDGRFENAFPRGAMTMFSVGKKRAGRLLDSRTWDEMPEERTGPEALRVAGGGRAGA